MHEETPLRDLGHLSRHPLSCIWPTVSTKLSMQNSNKHFFVKPVLYFWSDRNIQDVLYEKPVTSFKDFMAAGENVNFPRARRLVLMHTFGGFVNSLKLGRKSATSA